MSDNIRISKFRAHTAISKGDKDEQSTPRRMTATGEIKSISAIYSVQKYCSRIEELVLNMKRLCPLKEMSPFFAAYVEYKKQISPIVDQTTMFLRKLAPNFNQPTYHTSEDLRRYHNNFMSAVSHMNLKKQPIYYHAISELLNKLPLDLDKFLYKYRVVPQVRQFLGTFEMTFREKLHKVSQEIKTILLPLEFENLDFDKVFELVEKVRAMHRTFEIKLMPAVRQRILKDSNFPTPKETDWNSTIITLIPLLSNLPMFIEDSNNIVQTLPELTLSIEKLCNEIDELLPADKGVFSEANPLNKKNSSSDDKADELLEKALKLLGIPSTKQQQKIHKLELIVNSFESKISDMNHKIEESKKETAHMKEDLDRSTIIRRFQKIRAASDDIAKKFSNDKDNFLMFIVGKLRSLISLDFRLDEDDPYRMFNAIFRRLSKELEILRNENPDFKYHESSDEEAINEKENSKNKSDNEKDNNSSFKESFYQLYNYISQENDDDIDQKPIEELLEIAKKKIDTMKSEKLNNDKKDKEDEKEKEKNNNKDKEIESLKKEIGKKEYTLETVKSFNELTSDLNSLLGKNDNSFLPSSPSFQQYLEKLAQMKGDLTKIKEDMIYQPVHELLVKSSELFNAFGISLSSASFASEFSDNQQYIQNILTQQQSMNLSLTRLRNLLEEKDGLLQGETKKLVKLEKEYSILLKEKHKDDDIDPQQVIISIETKKSDYSSSSSSSEYDVF